MSEILSNENISIYQNKKYQCNVCCSYKSGNIPEDQWQAHTKKKDDARKEKEKDKNDAIAGFQIALPMDFQAVKLTPFICANAFYNKTKLACHNFTICNMATKEATCYWFSEDQNIQLVASLIDYLPRYCTVLHYN